MDSIPSDESHETNPENNQLNEFVYRIRDIEQNIKHLKGTADLQDNMLSTIKEANAGLISTLERKYNPIQIILAALTLIFSFMILAGGYILVRAEKKIDESDDLLQNLSVQGEVARALGETVSGYSDFVKARYVDSREHAKNSIGILHQAQKKLKKDQRPDSDYSLPTSGALISALELAAVSSFFLDDYPNIRKYAVMIGGELGQDHWEFHHLMALSYSDSSGSNLSAANAERGHYHQSIRIQGRYNIDRLNLAELEMQWGEMETAIPFLDSYIFDYQEYASNDSNYRIAELYRWACATLTVKESQKDPDPLPDPRVFRGSFNFDLLSEMELPRFSGRSRSFAQAAC